MQSRRNAFLLSALFVLGGLMHFVVPDRYVGIMPSWMPYQLGMVYISGVAEMMGGIGLLVPRFRRAAGVGLIALLIAVFPANVQMLTNAIHASASTGHIVLLWLRLPLQPLLIFAVYRAAIRMPKAKDLPA